MENYNWHKSELFPGAYALLDREEILIENPGSTWIGYTTRESARDNCQHDDIDPIPITPDTLKRAGFEKIPDIAPVPGIDQFANGEFYYLFLDDHCEYYVEDEEYICPKYFHELQARIFWDSDREILLTLEP